MHDLFLSLRQHCLNFLCLLQVHNRKSALFVAGDCFDLEVLQNVLRAYWESGYSCSFLQGEPLASVYRTGILVYLRGDVSTDLIHSIDAKICHIYDYSRTISHATLDLLMSRFTCTYISLQRPPAQCTTPISMYKYAPFYHPVYPRDWLFPGRLRAFFQTPSLSVHIGNRKSSIRDQKDPVYMQFEDILLNHLLPGPSAFVYGDGWHSIGVNARSVPLHLVPFLYSCSRQSIGVLWDIQRYKTLNTRFWLSPINGCVLYVEENSNIIHCPFVYQYSKLEGVSSLPSKSCISSGSVPFNRQEVSLLAVEFWDNHTSSLLHCIGVEPTSRFWPRFVQRASWKFVKLFFFAWSAGAFISANGPLHFLQSHIAILRALRLFKPVVFRGV